MLKGRRENVLYFCLSGLYISVLTPIFLIAYRPVEISLLGVFGGLWALFVAWTLLLVRLGRSRLGEGAYSNVVIGVLGVSSALFAVLLPRFLPGQYLPAYLVLPITNLIVWQLVTHLLRNVRRFIGLSALVRWLWFAVIVEAEVLARFTAFSALPLFFVAFPLGLGALLIGHIEDRSYTVASAGRVLPWGRALQFAVTAAAGLGGGFALILILSPERLVAIGRWLEPIFSLIFMLVLQTILLITFIVFPIVQWIVQWVFGHLLVPGPERRQPEPPPNLQQLMEEQPPPPAELMNLPPWFTITLRILIMLWILFLLRWVISKVRTSWKAEEGEEEDDSTIVMPSGNVLKHGLDQLRNIVSMAKRMGINRGLLVAISVQNIYANLTRIAAQRGYPRAVAQPPDYYLKDLIVAFGGHEPALQRITHAYMRVHYGNRRVTAEELRELRADYEQIRESAGA